MTKKNKVVLLGAIAVLLLLLVPGSTFGQNPLMNAADLIISFEGFSSTPYWDVSRYSWGYGTAAPGSTGTITEQQARAELQAHIQNDYNYLFPLLTVPLNANQWAALLSFSYNLGTGNADNLIDNINSGNTAALQTQWKKYVYADGAVNSDLVDRRNKEFAMWLS